MPCLALVGFPCRCCATLRSVFPWHCAVDLPVLLFALLVKGSKLAYRNERCFLSPQLSRTVVGCAPVCSGVSVGCCCPVPVALGQPLPVWKLCSARAEVRSGGALGAGSSAEPRASLLRQCSAGIVCGTWSRVRARAIQEEPAWKLTQALCCVPTSRTGLGSVTRAIVFF